MERFKPSRATSVGLVTNYRCTFRCRHCLYGSSPDILEKPDETILQILVKQMDRVLGAVPVHIGGGEPLLHFDRLKRLIGRITRSRILLEYVETNGSTLLQNTAEKLAALKDAGMSCLLVSISPFHNEFIALRRLMEVVRQVVATLGPDGLFPWHPGYLPFLERAGTGSPVALEDYWRLFSRSEITRQLTSIMFLHPGGRGVYLLARHLPLSPAESLLQYPCSGNLTSPVHVHMDYEGNYLTGFCSGLRLGVHTALDLESLYTEGIRLSRYPILEMLLGGGLKALYDYTCRQGYQPAVQGYGSSCHLCLDLRVFLYQKGQRCEDLYPAFLYEELGKG